MRITLFNGVIAIILIRDRMVYLQTNKSIFERGCQPRFINPELTLSIIPGTTGLSLDIPGVIMDDI